MDNVELGGNSAQQMIGFVERIERLVEERKAISDDIKDVKGEAKGQGFDTTMLMYVVKMRALEREKRAELLALQETYLAAAGLA